MPGSKYIPFLEVTRGSTVESVHFGAAAVVDSQGQLLAQAGDSHIVTFLRSSAKPFQALPLVELGGVEAFGLTEQEIALMCASHSGTDDHVAVAQSIQRKVGVSEEDLLCGTHPPYHEPTARRLVLLGVEPTPNRHNCSGKHTGMLAQARLRGLPIEDYINPQHPVQQLDLQVFAEMCGVPREEIALGIDGCSAPVFAIPLRNAALGYARLVDPVGAGLEEGRAAACQRIVSAMTHYPVMVGGPERFDTVLMEVTGGKILAKSGAEGFQGLGILPGVLRPGSHGVGVALKMADGDLGGRAVRTAAIAILRQLGALSAEQSRELARFDRRPIYNFRKLEVGEIRPIFELQDA